MPKRPDRPREKQRSQDALALKVRNKRGASITPARMPATKVKNEFGDVMEKVASAGFVVITKHDAAKAVLVSIDEFEALVGASEPDLDALSEEFDEAFTRMQTQKSKKAMKGSFEASPEKLGAAAVAARRRG